MARPRWRIGPVLLVLACAPTRSEREAPPAPSQPEAPPEAKTPDVPEPPAPAPARPDESRWTCETDEDCVQTCALGAVNRGWLEGNPNADDCDDGCYWNHDGVRCRDGGCVTIDANGDIDESCTRRTSSRYD